MTHLYTTLGPKRANELLLILPHEHVFVDLRTWDQPGYAQAEIAEVIALMAPEIQKAQAAGVTALVECTPVGVGRRADILKAVSEVTNLPFVVPTGMYREPWAHAASEDELFEWMQSELAGEIEESGVRAGFIKLSAGDDGLTETETKILYAASRAATATHAAIGSHTIRGRVVRDQLEIIEASGYTPDRFIWIHAQVEPDFELNLEMARRGAWIEYDSIGRAETEADILDRIQRMLDAGLGDRVLLSQDRGWFDPAQLRGGIVKPYTSLCDDFLPRLRAVGADEATIHMLTHTNPFRAFAR